MKFHRITTALAVLLLLVPSIRAEEERPDRPGPRLELQELQHDFGPVSQGEELVHLFPFTNSGTAPLLLAEPLAWCDCTAVVAGPSNVPPGEGGAIQVKINVGGRQGPWQKSVTLRSNDPEQPELVLTLTGTARVAAIVEPDCLVLSGLVVGQPVERQILLLPTEEGPFQILGVESSHESLQVTWETLRPERPGYRLDLVFQPAGPAGTIRESITVRTDLPHRPELRIPVLGSVRSSITLDPPWVSFRVLDPGDRPVQEVTLARMDEGELGLASLEPSDPFLAVEVVPIQENRRHRLKIRLTGEVPEGQTRSRIVVTTTNPELGSIEIPVRIFRRAVVADQADPPTEEEP